MSSPTILRHIHLPGITPFASAQALQAALVTQFLTHKALLSSPTPPASLPPAPVPTILTFVPTPVYTTGRREQDSLTPSQISKLKQPLSPLKSTSHNPNGHPEWAEISQTLRGGQTTFHGPGQLVIYPILDLRSSFPLWKKGINVRCYVHLLEQTTINTLSSWGLPAIRTENPGVWEEEGEKKIAALGVHLRRSITSYGVGLNVNTDLRWFDRIVACGLEGKKVTSMLALGKEKKLWKGGMPLKEDRQAWGRWVLGDEKENIGVENAQDWPEIELANDGRWKTKTKTAKQWRVRMKPSIVGRFWVREFARGLYGEGGEERVVKVDVKDLEDVDDGVIGELVRPAWPGRRKILPEEEEEELIRTMD
jgi:lipoate-protein ligase B